MVGQTVLHYKVIEKLGAGGMGVVYKAEDTKLKRTVALKFLPSQALGTEEEKARFVREAQAAAALNHPNIATVYEINEHEDDTFIAMEYIDGQTLKEKIADGPLKLKEAITIAKQIADGLNAAHEKGIVHRDIKSANVMLTKTGLVKIMDFGLAKVSMASMVTKAGTTLGTVGYMSPEQARGETVDQRADIWSLGVVFYEMISGLLPFKGEYEQALIYSILNVDPEPLTAIRTGVPMELERIVNKLLAKDPDDRYQNVIELPVDLKSIDITSTGTSFISQTAVTGMAMPKPAGMRKAIPWKFAAPMLAVSALAAALAVWFFMRQAPQEPANVMRFEIVERSFTLSAGEWGVVVSPDGRYVVYIGEDAGGKRLFLRPLDRLESISLAGTEEANSPFFSPDGRWIGFYSGGKLMKVLREGGPPIPITDVPFIIGASWGPDDTILYATFNNIWKVPASGASPPEKIEALVSKTRRHGRPNVVPTPDHSRKPNHGHCPMPVSAGVKSLRPRQPEPRATR